MTGFPYLNGSALALVILIAWAIHKTMKGEIDVTEDLTDDCLNNVVCGDCLRTDCLGCE